jgi:hypothetical protein
MTEVFDLHVSRQPRNPCLDHLWKCDSNNVLTEKTLVKSKTDRIPSTESNSADRVQQGDGASDVSDNLRNQGIIASMLIAAIYLISILAFYLLLARL